MIFYQIENKTQVYSIFSKFEKYLGNSIALFTNYSQLTAAPLKIHDVKSSVFPE